MLLLTILPYTLLLCFYKGVNGDEQPNLSLLPQECGFIDGEGVTDSKYAKLYEFPWMVLINRIARDGGRHFACSGTVINERYVLTAAHCVEVARLNLVRVGDYDIQQEVDCEGQGPTLLCEDQFQDISIDETIIHENYSSNGRVTNDIALLRLSTPIDFSHKNAAPVCLPTTTEMREKSLTGEEAIVSGWEIKTNGTPSKMLKMKTPIRKNDQCSEGMHGAFDPQSKAICTGGVEGVCPMLSGSSLMLPYAVKENQYRYIQYGIMSHGTLGCNSDQNNVYTDVSKYMDWILTKLKA
ncbi:phenoloxidase-activating factor 3-like [Epargyreus clarus]|uniref:phenoloxidase-activating factor 3-like n=1 Tax=Epargyreus clarus TaxID=520877 RepID=UPI003C2E8C53